MPKEKPSSDLALKTSATSLIRFVWIDYCGMVRCKVIPASLLGTPVRLVKAGMTLTPWGALAPGATGGPVGEIHLVPVVKMGSTTWLQWQQQPGQAHLSSRLELPWHPSHKIAISKMLHPSGEQWDQCPKGALSRAIALLRELGLNPKAGFELEFCLFEEDSEKGLLPVGRGASYASFDNFDLAADVIDDIIKCLEQMKISVRMVHAEAAPGQFEVVLGHKDVYEAVQDVLIARLAVKAVARKHGLVASFVPSCGDGMAGSGSHVHVSLDDHFGTSDEYKDLHIGVSEIGRSFMAGVLDALPWLSFLVMSSPLSYVRCQPQCWVGAYQSWGDNNRETPLRLMDDRTNFEIKLLDATSNVDIAMAGILLAGFKGVEAKKELPPPLQVDPHSVDEKERPTRLPQSLEESLEEFKKVYKQDELKAVFPNEMVNDLLCVKQAEVDYVKANGIADYRNLLLKFH